MEVMRKTGNNTGGRILRRTGMLGVLTVLLFAAVGCGNKEEEVVEAGPETAMEGVWIDNHNVSGMTYEQITEVIDQDIAARATEKIYFVANGMSVSVSAGDLGLYCTDSDLAEKALEFGKTGSAIQNYKNNSYIEENGSYIIDIPYAVNTENVRAVIQEKTSALSEGSGGSLLVHNEDGSFTVVPGENGMTIDEEPSVEKVVNYMNNEWTGGVGTTALVVKEGDISDEVKALELVKDLLGTFSTSYDATELERSQNIEVGTAKISGLLLYPGQSASVCTMLEPFTEEEGYAPAHAYEQGLIIDSLGGGVCQISSTLYNAILNAELQVDERCQHSMTVSYVAPSLDAAIAENTKDFIFTNNTDAPVLIEGSAGGGTVSFSVYGHETRDPNRSVTYESVILENVDYTYEYKFDDTAAIGTYETSEPRNGVVAEGYKCVYVNGELQSRELITKSKYQMSPMIYTIGTMGATDSELSALHNAVDSGDHDVVERTLGLLEVDHKTGGSAGTGDDTKTEGTAASTATTGASTTETPAAEAPASTEG